MREIADRGYRHFLLLTPNELKSSHWNHFQAGLRSVVESVISRVNGFGITTAKFHLSPEMQQLVLPNW